MVEKIVDLHIHSKYSRACSKNLELPNIAAACERKGINIAATGDFTHPLWFKHLAENLIEEAPGLFRVRNLLSPTRFVLGTEISCIYKHRDATRRLHLLLFAPHLAAVQKFTAALEKKGANLKADGRPIVGLSAKEIVILALEADPNMMVIPAHAWTPWFAVFGSKSGYDSLYECFEDMTPYIKAIETGLSSDPPMNRRLSALDGITLISNSDAHGLENLGREANVFSFKDEREITYAEIKRIIETGDRQRFAYTIEFYPEEGKYHYDGHKDCGVCLPPERSKAEGLRCPVCKKILTIGVLHRVADLADRGAEGVSTDRFIPHRYIIPLKQLIASVTGVSPASKKVTAEYDALIKKVGNEFSILIKKEFSEIAAATSNQRIAAAVINMRQGKIKISPGYDGVFGVIVPELPGLASSRQAELF